MTPPRFLIGSMLLVFLVSGVALADRDERDEREARGHGLAFLGKARKKPSEVATLRAKIATIRRLERLADAERDREFAVVLDDQIAREADAFVDLVVTFADPRSPGGPVLSAGPGSGPVGAITCGGSDDDPPPFCACTDSVFPSPGDLDSADCVVLSAWCAITGGDYRPTEGLCLW